MLAAAFSGPNLVKTAWTGKSQPKPGQKVEACQEYPLRDVFIWTTLLKTPRIPRLETTGLFE